tara:strand:+ start:749 stop:1507 length:759 start_codon:yes stop_codon:yes gene_type:complete
MLIPNKDSIFYFSVSNNPSKRGSEFYNKLFLKKKKNCIYLPLQIKTILDFKKFIKFLKSDIIKVGGISVSMPLKSIAQKYANVNHHSSLITKNANTLIFKKKKILAYNTDYLAAKKILSKRKFDNFIILGAGSLASSFINLLNGKKIFLFNRTKKNIKKIILNYKNIFELNRKNSLGLKNVCIINATPKNDYKKLLMLVDFNQTKYICDCIIDNRSILKNISKKYSIKYNDGNFFYINQRNFQKKIYLNEKI